MAEPGSADSPHGDVFTSDSYRRDIVNAVAYAVFGAILLGGALFWFAFLDSGSGSAGAAGVASATPLSASQAMRVGSLVGYLTSLFSVVCFLVVGYSGVVRPLQRATGMIESSAPDDDGSRAPISLETVNGTQTFAPDAECADCDRQAIGVIGTAMEDGAPSETVPVCPMHLHERRNEYEDRSQRVEVETFV